MNKEPPGLFMGTFLSAWSEKFPQLYVPVIFHLPLSKPCISGAFFPRLETTRIQSGMIRGSFLGGAQIGGLGLLGVPLSNMTSTISSDVFPSESKPPIYLLSYGDFRNCHVGFTAVIKMGPVLDFWIKQVCPIERYCLRDLPVKTTLLGLR